MTIQYRIALAISASLLTCGLALAPAAQAMDSMSKSAMHKHMKKHKGSMMKGDHMMKGDSMEGGDAMSK